MGEPTGREQWLEERRAAIGASESPSILGVNPWSSQLAVWASKKGLTIDDRDDDAIERMEWGHILEPVIIEEYSKRRGIECVRHDQTTVVRHSCFPDVPMACTPDAYDVDGRLVQIKTTSAMNADQWADGPPLHVIVQEQHEMAVTKRDEATIVVLIGGQKMKWFDLERNDSFIASLEDKLGLWWNSYVVANIEPPPEMTDPGVRALQQLHPDDNGTEILLGQEFVELDMQLQEIKTHMKALTIQRRDVENRIKAAIGGATFGVLPGRQGRYSWKTAERAEYTVKTSTYRTLRRLRDDQR